MVHYSVGSLFFSSDYYLRVFHTRSSWWYFSGVWVTASFLKCPGLFSVFWPISTMLYFGWLLFFLWFLNFPSPLLLSYFQLYFRFLSILHRVFIPKTNYGKLWVGRVFVNGPRDRGSIPDRVIPKTLKMVLDTSLLNTEHYKVRIKGKVEKSRERSSVPLHLGVVATEKGAFRSHSTKVANLTYLVFYVFMFFVAFFWVIFFSLIDNTLLRR